MKKFYEVKRDYQGGTFGMDRVQTAEEWLEDMLYWQEVDGTEPSDLEAQRKRWEADLAKGNEQDLIDYIAEVWCLDLVEVEG